MCWIVVSQFRQLCVMLRIGRRSLFLATALQPALPQSLSPAQTQAPTQSPRQQDCQSARGGHSCLFSESHGGGFNIFASGTTLIDGSLKLCTSCIDLENCRQTWHKETENWKKTADVGMHEERSECSLVFSTNFDLCDLLPTFFFLCQCLKYLCIHRTSLVLTLTIRVISFHIVFPCFMIAVFYKYMARCLFVLTSECLAARGVLFAEQ